MCPELPPSHKLNNTTPKHDNGQEKWGKGRGGRPWDRKRARVFKRDKYLCQEHYGQGKLVTVNLHGKNAGICDHIKPKSQGGTDNEDNLQTLCKACSDVKTLKESGKGSGYTFA